MKINFRPGIVCLSYYIFSTMNTSKMLAALTQMIACLPLVQQGRGSIPGGLKKIFNLRARRGGDVHFLIARLYIIGLN